MPADLERVKTAQLEGRCRVIAINDTYKSAPWADVLYACDPPWWAKHKGVPDFTGEKWTQDPDAAREWGLNYVRGRSRPGMSLDPAVIHYGGNSGYQTINLAGHFTGGGRVLLLGFDMQLGADGRRHHHDTEPSRFPGFSQWIRNFAGATADIKALGLEVINCSRATSIPESTFPRAELESVL